MAGREVPLEQLAEVEDAAVASKVRQQGALLERGAGRGRGVGRGLRCESVTTCCRMPGALSGAALACQHPAVSDLPAFPPPHYNRVPLPVLQDHKRGAGCWYSRGGSCVPHRRAGLLVNHTDPWRRQLTKFIPQPVWPPLYGRKTCIGGPAASRCCSAAGPRHITYYRCRAAAMLTASLMLAAWA